MANKKQNKKTQKNKGGFNANRIPELRVSLSSLPKRNTQQKRKPKTRIRKNRSLSKTQ